MVQDVVSLEPRESCGSSVSQTEKQLVAGEPTEEMCYLKKLHNRYCLPSWLWASSFQSWSQNVNPERTEEKAARLCKVF